MWQFMATSATKTKSSDLFILVAFVTSVERGSEMFGGLQIGSAAKKMMQKKIEQVNGKSNYDRGEASGYAISDVGSG